METVTDIDFLRYFPKAQYPKIHENQRAALEFVGRHQDRRVVILELPTGSGKTAVGWTFLCAHRAAEGERLFYIVPTKTLVEQVKALHPDVVVAMGRNEFPCLYYPEGEITAQEVPCSMLVDCAHRVDLETGKTHVPNATPCPYLQQKYEARKAKGPVVSTVAYYLFNEFFGKSGERPDGLVIDEAHQIARCLRSILSFEITDYRLGRAQQLLKQIGARKAALQLTQFLRAMAKIVRGKPAGRLTVLEPHELQTLITALEKIDADELDREVRRGIREKRIDAHADRETLREIEIVVRDLTRYVKALEFSLPSEDRGALNYTCAYHVEEIGPHQRYLHKLVVKAYYVVPLVKAMLGTRTLAYSATVGDEQTFGFETGLRGAFKAFTSDFPAAHTRVFMPTDTPNLAERVRKKGEPARVLRRIAKAAKRLARRKLRSLVLLVSERERQQFLALAGEEGLRAISYGEGLPAKDAMRTFQSGEGEALVGTTANYGEGIDLPKGIAPVIFDLRPGYPSPHDPLAIFERRRWGNAIWQVWNWRAMVEVLQARGRNIRSVGDRGVIICISQQFRGFLFAALPEELKAAYVRDRTFDQCVRDAEQLLG